MASSWVGILAIAGVAIGLGAAIRGAGALRRRRGTRRIPPALRTRQAQRIRVRVEVDASSVLPGMNAARRNVTTADLALSEARMVLSSERGVLLDLTAGRSRPLRAARCTGPGRLVLEGDAPRMNGEVGQFRIELAIDHAEAWASDLRRYVSPTPSEAGAPRP